MARQQLNVRRRSVVTYVGISEHGPCGYCKFTKRAHDKAKFVTGQGDASTSLSASPSSPLAEVPTVASSSSSTTAKTEADDANALSPNVANSQDTATDDDGSDHGNSAVFGLWAHQLTVQHYQWLADRGWRRSGRFLYKPLMDRTCCPQYTIRLDVHKFRLSRTQKRVLRAMRDFLRADQRPKNGRAVVNDGESPTEGGRREKGQTAKAKSEGTAGGDGQKQRKRRRRRGSSATTTTAQPQQQQSGTTDDMAKTNTKTKTMDAHGMERQPKKKAMRRRRAEKRLKARGIDLEEYKSQRAARETARRRTIQSFLDGYNEPSWAHAFELRLIGQPSLDFDQDFDEEFELFKRYQMQIHREKETDLTPDAFRRFLGSSPLFPGPPTAEGRTPDAMDNKGSGQQQQMQDGLPRRPNLGSYHQQYRLDGRLIAVAVIDLLPRCLSAKYFFYDPDYAFLSLGTYSALREIAFTQLLAQHRPDLHFYYMGFYLYDCPKMRYKSRFRPSELLCDHCFNWVSMTECERILAANGGRFSTFHPSGEPIRAQLDNAQIDQIICLYGDPPQPLTFANLRHSLSAPVSAASSSGSPHDGEEEAEMGYAPDRPSSTTSSRVVSLHQLTNEVRTFAHHAGLTALEMVLVLS